ncbi:MAG: hypothetical protein LBG94_02480 [Treponema sp.]|jgi:hypothetical protein|nr:hypothetical protein [Treponema sp.]
MKFKFLTVFILIFFFVFSAHKQELRALDFGLVIEQNADYAAQDIKFAEPGLEYSGVVIPRVSGFLGANGEFYISAAFNYSMEALKEFNFFTAPDLLRTEAVMRFGANELSIGRMYYRDPMGIIAEGLFDGAQLSYDTREGTFSIGCWYTGLQYKTRAAIYMTENEYKSYHNKLDYSSFTDSYFAPKRLLSHLGWQRPSAGGIFDINLAIIEQLDISGSGLHSRYITAKTAVQLKQIILTVGGCLELIDNRGDVSAAFAGNAGITWILPTRNEQHILMRGIYSSGTDTDNSISAFLPLTTIPQGDLLNAKLSGLSALSFNYLARFGKTFASDLSAQYFIRSDTQSYSGYPLIGEKDSEGMLLGAEFYLRFIWSVSTGIQINFGAGAFLPSLGNAAPDADMLIRAHLKAVISIF